MPGAPQASSWLTAAAAARAQMQTAALTDPALVRLWQALMTARVLIALGLLLVQLALHRFGLSANGHLLVALCAGYLSAAFAVRMLMLPRQAGQGFDAQWIASIGVDLLAFTALQLLQTGSFNYTPLYALPVLMASMLGSLLPALGTAAGVTLLLLADAWWASLQSSGDTTSRLLQTSLTGSGYFALAFLINQLAARLTRQEQIAWRSQHAAQVQTQVNQLVIETLADGVLVIDETGGVQAANPAASQLLGRTGHSGSFALSQQPGWQTLESLARATFEQRQAQWRELVITAPDENPRRVLARTQLTAPQDHPSDHLCVMFLQDLRELEARLRTEKLAAMGRMSAAVAHEIRNPLAAITQANALLAEDLTDPAQQKLSGMVRQNAQRLARIVEDVLDISRVQHQPITTDLPWLKLDASVAQGAQDWARQNACGERLQVILQCPDLQARFAPDHLRRVLINLLDNALRHAGQGSAAIVLETVAEPSGSALLRVWSNGLPLEHSVEKHLFEPFFSSQSRSSGLGLYICRELCERYAASIGYRRSTRQCAGQSVSGNEFYVQLQTGAIVATAVIHRSLLAP